MKIRLFAESVCEERKEKVNPEVYWSEHLPDGPLKAALGPGCKITVSSGSANILLEELFARCGGGAKADH